ncbi:hypothetical protein [Mesorhizobium sp.]|uniref:hypothetical protein n=1 Tax=Mesorhizobium sp. TaxID=1871066 RepID=UPI000FEA224C|nr:hypothetical protein [Mesorhizobium sp.]RWA67511.1 MAG: hypothetical protein EOQ29_23720 [Mesorhizobium sp.]
MQPAGGIFVYGDPNSGGGNMKSFRANNPVFILPAVMLTAAPFAGLGPGVFMNGLDGDEK